MIIMVKKTKDIVDSAMELFWPCIGICPVIVSVKVDDTQDIQHSIVLWSGKFYCTSLFYYTSSSIQVHDGLKYTFNGGVCTRWNRRRQVFSTRKDGCS